MTRWSSLVLSIALLAPVAAGAQMRDLNITVRLRAYEAPVRLDTLLSWSDVLAPRAVTFAALRTVLDSLSLPVQVADSARGFLYNPGFTARSRIAGRNMSWAFRCGQGPWGDYANTYRLTIAYAIVVEATDETASRVGTAAVASAENVEGTSTAPIACGNTGALERAILKATHLETIKRPKSTSR